MRRDKTKVTNGLRSGVVVIGALAFGYLNFHLVVKPFLERAQSDPHLQHQLSQSEESPPKP